MEQFKWLALFILAMIGFAGISGLFITYQIEINTAQERIKSLQSQVIETACGPIEMAKTGSGSPVLVIHGAMGGFDQGLDLADTFIDKNYQAIAVSRAGYLRTPLPAEASINQQADAYACLLDILGLQKINVFATSAGATSAIRFAARYPERVAGLVLLSPAAPGDVRVGTPPKALMEGLMGSDFVFWSLKQFFRPFMLKMVGVADGFTLTAQMEAEVEVTLASTLPSQERVKGMIFDSYTSAPDFYEEISERSPYPLSNIKIPVLVINALDDPLAVPKNVRGLAEKLPDARLYLVPDGGHLLLGHSDEVKAEITRFLNKTMADESQYP
jgi:pimeloyl-ACP methyl ester carboxylesterase